MLPAAARGRRPAPADHQLDQERPHLQPGQLHVPRDGLDLHGGRARVRRDAVGRRGQDPAPPGDEGLCAQEGGAHPAPPLPQKPGGVQPARDRGQGARAARRLEPRRAHVHRRPHPRPARLLDRRVGLGAAACHRPAHSHRDQQGVLQRLPLLRDPVALAADQAAAHDHLLPAAAPRARQAAHRTPRDGAATYPLDDGGDQERQQEQRDARRALRGDSRHHPPGEEHAAPRAGGRPPWPFHLNPRGQHPLPRPRDDGAPLAAARLRG
mmetsp:Transcript_19226/g.59890  ORF Transcript_19226/g.59890 Transcript_19226/m.59890 type:complete len:267 (+) Transcript_19226:102-902(+)